jgi:hypothetical protein
MKRRDVNYLISILLMISIVVTGSLGYIQSELEIRKFFPHRYAAYTTLSLASIHIYLSFGKVWRYLKRIFSKRR